MKKITDTNDEDPQNSKIKTRYGPMWLLKRQYETARSGYQTVIERSIGGHGGMREARFGRFRSEVREGDNMRRQRAKTAARFKTARSAVEEQHQRRRQYAKTESVVSSQNMKRRRRRRQYAKTESVVSSRNMKRYN
jgi:hypothetical protein